MSGCYGHHLPAAFLVTFFGSRWNKNRIYFSTKKVDHFDTLMTYRKPLARRLAR